jgi:hypothetical protein
MKGRKWIVVLGLAIVAKVALASAAERCVLAELFTAST